MSNEYILPFKLRNIQLFILTTKRFHLALDFSFVNSKQMLDAVEKEVNIKNQGNLNVIF